MTPMSPPTTGCLIENSSAVERDGVTAVGGIGEVDGAGDVQHDGERLPDKISTRLLDQIPIPGLAHHCPDDDVWRPAFNELDSANRELRQPGLQTETA